MQTCRKHFLTVGRSQSGSYFKLSVFCRFACELENERGKHLLGLSNFLGSGWSADTDSVPLDRYPITSCGSSEHRPLDCVGEYVFVCTCEQMRIRALRCPFHRDVNQSPWPEQCIQMSLMKPNQDVSEWTSSFCLSALCLLLFSLFCPSVSPFSFSPPCLLALCSLCFSLALSMSADIMSVQSDTASIETKSWFQAALVCPTCLAGV